jgi:phage minor structural protein
LCETFECWAEFIIEHDNIGRVTEKKVKFHNYIGKDNYAGFRYGVNLKQTKRTLDSKAVVSKLIVPDNSNEYANNGFCSIARAASNESGENYIYNFQYYTNMGLVSKETLDDYLADYYNKLWAWNNELNGLVESYTSMSNSLMKAHADLQVA